MAFEIDKTTKKQEVKPRVDYQWPPKLISFLKRNQPLCFLSAFAFSPLSPFFANY